MFTEKLAEGLAALPYNELVRRSAAHMAREGRWESGVLRPSLLAMECRLARAKAFFGHPPQPGATFDHARQGEPDPASNLVMARGAWLEGVVVTALEAAGVTIVLRSPESVQSTEAYRWPSVFSDDRDWQFECHPDLIVGPQARPIQIKCPSDRALSYFLDGRREMVLSRYGTQILAELYIMELAGWEPEEATLLLVSAEPWPPLARPLTGPIRAIEVNFAWGPQQRAAIQARIDATKADIEAARQGIWPNPLVLEKAHAFPCSYCPYPRIPTLTARVSCDNHAAWEAPPVPSLRLVDA